MMHGGARVTRELPEWVRLAIADAAVLFGRLEQEIIEIAWLIKGANEKVERERLLGDQRQIISMMSLNWLKQRRDQNSRG